MSHHTHHIFAGDTPAVCRTSNLHTRTLPAMHPIEGKPMFHNSFSNGMQLWHVIEGEVFAVPFLTDARNLEYYLHEDWFIFARDCLTGAHYHVCTELWEEWDYEAIDWNPVLSAAEKSWADLDWQPVFGNCQLEQEIYYQFHKRYGTIDAWKEAHSKEHWLMAMHELPYKERRIVMEELNEH